MASNVLKFNNPIVVGTLSADPGTADPGTIYYNSSTGKFRRYEAGAWSDLASYDVLDNVFRISDDVDSTKKIAFQASGVGTGVTRTISMPNSDVNLGLVATALQTSQLGAINGVASLDASGLIPSSQLPPLAITSTTVVANNTARDALTAQEGDVAIVTSSGLTYIKDGAGVWQQITAAGAVSSVNGQSGTVSLTTDNINQGSTNLYYTATQARSDLIASAITSGDTTHAPNGGVVFTALAAKLASVSQDTAPSLGGNLDLNAKELIGLLRRDGASGAGNFVEQEYIHAITLLASQSGVSSASLAFAFASFEGCEITYKMKEATTNRIRIGTLRVVTDGTNLSLTDTFNETGDVGVSWVAAINGSNVELRYTSTANNKVMRADVKRFKV